MRSVGPLAVVEGVVECSSSEHGDPKRGEPPSVPSGSGCPTALNSQSPDLENLSMIRACVQEWKPRTFKFGARI